MLTRTNFVVVLFFLSLRREQFRLTILTRSWNGRQVQFGILGFEGCLSVGFLIILFKNYTGSVRTEYICLQLTAAAFFTQVACSIAV